MVRKLTSGEDRFERHISSALDAIDLLGKGARQECRDISGRLNHAAADEFVGRVAMKLFPIARQCHPGSVHVPRACSSFADAHGVFMRKKRGGFRCFVPALPDD
ncbi:MAG: hypothetical protein AAF354_14085 [Pseudomonadota bacterium]